MNYSAYPPSLEWIEVAITATPGATGPRGDQGVAGLGAVIGGGSTNQLLVSDTTTPPFYAAKTTTKLTWNNTYGLAIGTANTYTGNNFTVVGTISAGPGGFALGSTGTIVADNDISAGGNIGATGNIQAGGNISAGAPVGGTGNISADFDITAGGNITAQGNVTAYSDVRLKKDIATIDNPLDKIRQMRGVYFTMDTRRRTGVIAQETEKVLPEVVFTDSSAERRKSVDYGNIVGILIEGIKALDERCAALEKTVNTK